MASRLMSTLCRKWTHAPQQTASLFDYFVGEREHGRRYFEAERLGGLKVDDKLEHGRMYDCMTGRSAGFSPLRRLYGFDDTMPLRPGAADYVQMARREGENKSAVACAPHQVVAMHLSIGRSVSGAQPPIRAADAPARD